ncbi:hypothetical protein [Azospirillum argentinense]|uniref:hypothetical protein n=1 Tax=Azospirillum argentinense TaxID=2970906 RepID=UPI0010C0043F|nr:hypothetical protein [Azospirillum argentinense]
MRIAALSLLPLLESYQQLAACCAAQASAAPDDLDGMLGNLEHVLACAEVETPEDLIAKGRFLLTYRNDPAMIPRRPWRRWPPASNGCAPEPSSKRSPPKVIRWRLPWLFPPPPAMTCVSAAPSTSKS